MIDALQGLLGTLILLGLVLSLFDFNSPPPGSHP